MRIHVSTVSDFVEHTDKNCICRPVRDKVCKNVIIHNRVMTKMLYEGKLYSKWAIMNVEKHDICSVTFLTRSRARKACTSYYNKVVKVLLVVC